MINISCTTYNQQYGNAFYRNFNLGQKDKLATVTFGNALNINNKASKFFGVDSRQNVLKKLENHINLALQKCKDSGILPSFPRRAFFSVDEPKTLANAWEHIWSKSKGKKFEELLNKPARLTFDSKFFGESGFMDSHTIGILFEPKTKTLFCLDSLSNFCKQVKEYQKILKKHIFNCPNCEIKKIIFSNKHQQNMNEYTCNNWTIANIEALQQALKSGKRITNTKELNAILPDDINKILQEQYDYLLQKESGSLANGDINNWVA